MLDFIISYALECTFVLKIVTDTIASATNVSSFLINLPNGSYISVFPWIAVIFSHVLSFQKIILDGLPKQSK